MHLKLKIKKCSFIHERIEFLRNYIDASGVHDCPKKVEAVKDFPKSQKAKELRSSLGIAGYYKQYISGFADIFAVLHATSSKKAKSFECTHEMQAAFDAWQK